MCLSLDAEITHAAGSDIGIRHHDLCGFSFSEFHKDCVWSLGRYFAGPVETPAGL